MNDINNEKFQKETNMSYKVNLKSIEKTKLRKLQKYLTVSNEKTGDVVQFFRRKSAKDLTAMIPMGAARRFDLEGRRSLDQQREWSFNGTLRPYQEEVKKEILTKLKKGSLCLSLFVGFGKSPLACYLAKRIGLKTCIIVKTITLLNQWVETCIRFLPDCRVVKLTPKTPKSLLEDGHIFVTITNNIEKYPQDWVERIGFLVLDEAHLLASEKSALGVLRFTPRYMIGLTGTAFRYDEFDDVLVFLFGDNLVKKPLKRHHQVKVIRTGIRPRVEYNPINRKIDWSIVLSSLAEDPKRNAMIVRGILEQIENDKKRCFIVLVKRVDQGHELQRMIQEQKIRVDSLLESKQEFDRECQVLIGTTGKISTGFDWPPANTLILAADIGQYFEQALGRILRKQSDQTKITPLVIDFVDSLPSLERHFQERKKTYLEIGGDIDDPKPTRAPRTKKTDLVEVTAKDTAKAFGLTTRKR